MKLFPKIIFYLLLGAGVLMIFLPISWFPSFYDVRFTAVSMILGALIIHFLPKLFVVPADSLEADKKNKAANILRFLLTSAVFAHIIGVLGFYELYQYGFAYSYVLHVVMPFIGTILLAQAINWRFGIKITRSVVIAFLIIIIWGVLWEIFENVSDLYLGTRLAGLGQTNTKNTTMPNLIQDAIGATSGLIFSLLKAHFISPKNNPSN